LTALSRRPPAKTVQIRQWPWPTSSEIRTDLVAPRTSKAKAVAALQVENAKVNGEGRAAEADLVPVRRLATLLGAADEDAMRWFILGVALLLDLAAALLLLVATGKR
jgi:hypothetical protein